MGDVDYRLVLTTALPYVWGVRLTYNFYRKGGYNLSSEDYRWPILREKMPAILFQLFNLLFISFYQNVLLFLITLPAYICYQERGTPLNAIDYIAASLFVLCLIGETIADEQQWAFQSTKYEKKSKNEELKGDYAKGFLTTGLFSYSRHPNFFCEQCIWWAYYLFSVAASGVWFNWSIVGTILLTLLFQGSTNFTEQITISKYPQYVIRYKDYKSTTSRLIPWFPGKIKSKKE